MSEPKNPSGVPPILQTWRACQPEGNQMEGDVIRNIEDEEDVDQAIHGTRPGPEYLAMYEAPRRAQRSYSAILRAIARKELPAKKWGGMWFIKADDLDKKYNPNEFQRRREAEERRTHEEASAAREAARLRDLQQYEFKCR